jgi:hypothetical protein
MPDGGPVRMICSDRSSDILILCSIRPMAVQPNPAVRYGLTSYPVVGRLSITRSRFLNGMLFRPAVRRRRRQPEIPTHGRPGDAVDCLANLSANRFGYLLRRRVACPERAIPMRYRRVKANLKKNLSRKDLTPLFLHFYGCQQEVSRGNVKLPGRPAPSRRNVLAEPGGKAVLALLCRRPARTSRLLQGPSPPWRPTRTRATGRRPRILP